MTAELLAVILPALGCLLAGVAAGRAWGRAGAEDAAEAAWALGFDQGERRALECAGVPVDSIPAGHRGLDGLDGPFTAAVDPAPFQGSDEGPLVPLPDRLPDADTLTRMYATLGGDTELPPAGVASSETLGPRPGEPATVWDSDAPAERVPTIAELAEDAEYRLCWAELGAMRDSARAWYAETFSTGTLPAVR